MSEPTKIVHVDGGHIEIWQKDDGLFGVSLLPDKGEEGYPGTTFTSTQDIDGFPETYDLEALKVWGREQWAKRLAR